MDFPSIFRKDGVLTFSGAERLMKKIGILLTLVICLFTGLRAQAQPYGDPSYGGQPPPPPQQYQEDPTHRSGWFLGSDQGVLFFVGNSSNLLNAQYYSTIFGGYDIKGYFQPMLRIGSAIGNAEVFFNSGTWFFTFEGVVRATPLRYKIRPYFEASAGLYILSFDDFGFPIRDGTNFTWSAGGGIEFIFAGHNAVSVGSAYRGFVNEGFDFNGVTVTFSYAFKF